MKGLVTRILISPGMGGFILIFPLILSHIITTSPPDHIHGRPITETIVFIPSLTGCGGQFVSVQDDDKEQRVVELVNEERASRDLPPLKRISGLMYAARYHAVDMEQEDYFDHHTYDRSTNTLDWICSWSDRISAFYTNWNRLGENIAAGASDPASVMDMWMNSDGHRSNILSEDFWEIGVGYSTSGSSFGHFWVQDFGRRWENYPLVINREAASTDSPQVNLYIYGQWDEIRIRNDNQAWSAWQAFQSKMVWELPAYTGSHTVTVEMRSSQVSATSSDQIYLTAGEPKPNPDLDKVFLPFLVKSLENQP